MLGMTVNRPWFGLPGSDGRDRPNALRQRILEQDPDPGFPILPTHPLRLYRL